MYFMKTALLMALLILSPSAGAQTKGAPASKGVLSIREQIQADRAKAKMDEENGPKERFWDRDVNGKRPWDRKEAPLPRE